MPATHRKATVSYLQQNFSEFRGLNKYHNRLYKSTDEEWP
jgi:hypothetical protein